MAKYRLLSGFYKCKDGNTYKKGDVFESEKDLCKVFVNKFELVERTLPTQTKTDGSLSSPSSAGGEDKLKASPLVTVSEVDVTDEFSRAVKIGGLKIVKVTNSNGVKGYNVIDSGNGQLHNSKPIKTFDKVKKFLKNIAEDDTPEK